MTPYKDTPFAWQRFEAKYIISELQAVAFRDYIYPYVTADAHSQAYFVSSLYLDSPKLSLFHSSDTGEKNRHKLRIRAYDDNPASPVFFEIKRRVDGVIIKSRIMVRRDAIAPILDGARIPPNLFWDPSDTQAQARLFEFQHLMTGMRASPRAMVRYDREAYVSNLEEQARVTFDRHLCALPALDYDPRLWAADNPWRALPRFPVVLEIKFTGAYPAWIAQGIRRFRLLRDSFAKYVMCLKLLEHEGFSLTGAPRNISIWSS